MLVVSDDTWRVLIFGTCLPWALPIDIIDIIDMSPTQDHIPTWLLRAPALHWRLAHLDPSAITGEPLLVTAPSQSAAV
jgi:hypothetical protein